MLTKRPTIVSSLESESPLYTFLSPAFIYCYHSARFFRSTLAHSDTQVLRNGRDNASSRQASSTLLTLSSLKLQILDVRNGTGPANSLFINHSIPKPSPKPTDAIVKIKCFGLNRMDLLQREGHYPVPPQAPKTLGVEFSGTIESFGSDAEKGFKVGDEVFGLAYGGAYAEYIAVSTHMLMHRPKELSWEQAAGVPEVCHYPFR